MTKKQNEILEFLSKFKSCNEEQLKFFTNCTIQDINFLISSNLIVRDEKTRLLFLRMRKKADVRTAVALDVVKFFHNDIKSIGYSRFFPVIFSVVTNDNVYCDIAVVRAIEQETVFKKLRDYSNADKIILVLENDNYNKRMLNTSKEVLICTYPIKIIDKIN